jgi:hypothetical protein
MKQAGFLDFSERQAKLLKTRNFLERINNLIDWEIFRPVLGKKAGFEASGGQIVDATFVEVPRQRNGCDDNNSIKKGEVPAGWSGKKKVHKDKDARWTKKNGTGIENTN